jgi:arylsulfatase A-like enzyme
VALAALLCWLAAGCAEAPPPPRANLILISIDTLRADRIGAYGYARGTSPRIDALARGGLLFENAVAESGWTLPSHVTMLTGLAPRTHGVNLPAMRVGADTELLAERLRGAGARTFGSTAGIFVGARHGFDRGFQVFDDERKPLPATLERAQTFLAGLERDERFFLFLHTYDVHCPYEPADASARLFHSEAAEPFETAGKCGNPHFNEQPLADAQLRHLSDLYDASVFDADAAIGGFVDWLEARGLLASTLLVITSDHGEELGEHGLVGHEGTVYAEALRVPLVIAGPGLAAARFATPVGLADLEPTLLELLGVEPPAQLDGRSLAPLFRGLPLEEQPRFSEVRWKARRESAMTRTHHLVEDLEQGGFELFDLRADPADATDLSQAAPELASELLAALRAFRARPGATRNAQPIGDPGPARLAELRALGYVE